MSSVDVVVPCYNYSRFLRECVTSILAQTGPPVRVLILDDASHDETPEVASSLMEEDSRVFYRRHHENIGHIKTYNEGIEWVTANYYLLLSADDYLLPGALQRSASLLDDNQNVAFVFGNVIETNQTGERYQIRPFPDTPETQERRIIKGSDFIHAFRANNVVPTTTALIRTELQKLCGGYRTDLPHAGDWEMWLRLSARGDIGFINRDQAVRRLHGKNMSNQYFADTLLLDLQQRFEVLRVFFSENDKAIPDLDKTQRTSFLVLAEEVVGLASQIFNEGRKSESLQLANYALEISPDIRNTILWRNLTIKLTIGPRLWRAIHSIWK